MKAKALLLAVLAPAAALAWNAEQSWRIPSAEYQNLDFTLRAGVDRATKIFEQAVYFERHNQKPTEFVRRYRAAAAEWRKVQVQAEAENFDEIAISYSVFMQAYSKELARDRNEALKLYAEIQDLHGDVTWVSIPARFRTGCTYLSLGETKKGNAIIDELAADTGAAGHPVAADAALMVARRRWAEGKIEEAFELLTPLLGEKSRRKTRDQWGAARDTLLTMAFVTGRGAMLDEIVFACVKDDDKRGRRDAVNWASDRAWYQRIWWGWGDYSSYATEAYPKMKDAERNAKIKEMWLVYAKWFDRQRPVYEAVEGGRRDYAIRHLRANAGIGKQADLVKEFEALVKEIRSEKDEKAAEQLAYTIIDILHSVGMGDMARNLPDAMKNPLTAAWMRSSLAERANKWKEAVKHCDEYLSLKPTAEQQLSCKRRLAWLCHERTHEYERAVKLYQEINDPPGTLWSLARVYRAMGKKRESYNQLTEIASVFANDAAAAVYQSACWMEEDGRKKEAIALYRRLLTHPEWKKSPQSSGAHQALERHGIATGGAMVNEVH